MIYASGRIKMTINTFLNNLRKGCYYLIKRNIVKPGRSIIANKITDICLKIEFNINPELKFQRYANCANQFLNIQGRKRCSYWVQKKISYQKEFWYFYSLIPESGCRISECIVGYKL